MRAYRRDDEERIRLQARVRDWARAGLLDAKQGADLDASLRTDLRRTNPMLRAVLAFFTAVIVAAAAGFFVAFFQIRDDLAVGLWLGFAALAAIAAAERLIATSRFYRFGVEEALAMMAVALGSLSVMLVVGDLWAPQVRYDGSITMVATVAFAAAASLGVFARYGLVYAAVASMAFAAALPFQLNWQPWVERVVSAIVLGAVFGVARRHHQRHGDDHPGNESAILQAVSWLGVYLVLNLQLTLNLMPGMTHVPAERWFYWASYAVVWAMPPLGLWWGIRDKDSALIAVNLLLAIATLATNKPYLGWPRHSWDPMVVGALMIGTALLIRRWLASAPHQQRFGFTATSLLEADHDVVTALGNVSAAWHPHAAAPPETSDPRFGGGRSGGGGATGSF